MRLPVDDQLRQLCAEIVAAGLSLETWRATESSDQFQRERYHGGFEELEDAFCFSFYPPAGGELWFQITLEEAGEIAAGRQDQVAAREAQR
jgi:hypothetical protein